MREARVSCLPDTAMSIVEYGSAIKQAMLHREADRLA